MAARADAVKQSRVGYLALFGADARGWGGFRRPGERVRLGLVFGGRAWTWGAVEPQCGQTWGPGFSWTQCRQSGQYMSKGSVVVDQKPARPGRSLRLTHARAVQGDFYAAIAVSLVIRLYRPSARVTAAFRNTWLPVVIPNGLTPANGDVGGLATSPSSCVA